MADFCRQCNWAHFEIDESDCAPTKLGDQMAGLYNPVLCEGCGPTQIDWQGYCIYHKGRTSSECFKDTERNR